MGTNANQVLPEMLARRRDRAISIVLSAKERDCERYLPRDVSVRLRKVILDQMNDLADFAIDVCSSLDSGDVVLNEVYLRKLDEIHDAMMRGPDGSIQ